MTTLGTITIHAASSVCDARTKIHGLATALGFDDVIAARLAIATSQACRALAAGDGGARIEAELRVVASGRTALALTFVGQLPAEADGWLASAFDAIERVRCDGGGADAGGSLCAVKWIPPAARALTGDELQAQRHRLEQRSRQELMEEVRAQNEALERHSAHLEQTVAARTLAAHRGHYTPNVRLWSNTIGTHRDLFLMPPLLRANYGRFRMTGVSHDPRRTTVGRMQRTAG